MIELTYTKNGGITMKQFIIGVSPRFSTSEKTGYQFLQINMDYIKQITNRNAIPLILTPSNSFKESLAMCDGFIIIGGDDINPICYHETNELGLSKGINDVEDALDKEIFTYCLENKVPLLGICRGIQAIAAFDNGSLYQDIATFHLRHAETEKKHTVERVNIGNLSKLLPENFLVNSFHHQAVKSVSSDYIVTYKNQDVIEAIEHKTLPIYGVQWHPERFYTQESAVIFDYFWEKINEYRKNN